MYTMQVKIFDGHKWEWKDVHPTNGPAYVYATEQEAKTMLSICYHDEFIFAYGEEVRVHKMS